MTKTLIIGYSGHAFVVIDAAIKSGKNIIGYSEKNESIKNPFNLNYIGFEEDNDFQGWNKGFDFVLGIGNNLIREKNFRLLNSKQENIKTVFHPSAIIGSNVEIEAGTFIAAGAMINPLAKIGKATIINTGSIIEHECYIGNFTHIAPGAVLAGNVKVGERAFIGANSVIKEGVTIGDDVIVGAGTVVINDILSGNKVVGNPGREL